MAIVNMALLRRSRLSRTKLAFVSVFPSRRISVSADSIRPILKSQMCFWRKRLPSTAGGVVTANTRPRGNLNFLIRQDRQDRPDASVSLALVIEVGKASLMLSQGKLNKQWKVLALTCIPNPNSGEKEVGVEAGQRLSYWLSFDRNNMTLKYGKGYHMEETTQLVFDFLEGVQDAQEQDRIRKQWQSIFGPEYKVVEIYDTVSGSNAASIFQSSTKSQGDVADYEPTVYVDRRPLTVNAPPFIRDSKDISMFDLDAHDHTFSSDLPGACQVLYANVTAADVAINYTPAGQPYGSLKLSDAISHSLANDGCILNKKLRDKGGFGGDVNENYLRVTLGPSQGNSPGIPYVLEIWPGGCYSPVHNHGNAYAVIKVLHGELNVNVYNKLREVRDLETTLAKTASEPPVLKTVPIKAGDQIWIDPNWYQAHKLVNPHSGHLGQYCATVQCYQYGADDELAWAYFAYLAPANDNVIIEEFYPDSDFTFVDMYHAVMKEFADFVSKSGA